VLVAVLIWGGAAEAGVGTDEPVRPGWLDAEALAAPIEPIVAFAETDVRALRRSRTALTIAAMAPAANHVAHLATSPSLEETGVSGQQVGAVGLLGASSIGMLVLPALLDSQAQASRRSIVAQGGTVRRVSVPVLTGLLSAVPLVVRGIPEAGEDASAGRVVLAYGAYAAVVALPLNQLLHNRRARQRAGWVGGR